jgi:hypothetical protein
LPDYWRAHLPDPRIEQLHGYLEEPEHVYLDVTELKADSTALRKSAAEPPEPGVPRGEPETDEDASKAF